MDRKSSDGHIVLPIFYHVNPSDMRHLGGSFGESFKGHELKGLQQVQRWEEAFAKVGELKGWHIKEGKSDRPNSFDGSEAFWPSLICQEPSTSKGLRQIPDLSGAINLKRIDMSGCTRLVEIPSFNDLASLEFLHLNGCEKLRQIPDLSSSVQVYL
ncbi:hypothetical protein V6N13_004785 [Hibiscus sabdariffa]